MQPTLITDFEHDALWLQKLERLLQIDAFESISLRIWIRDKGLTTHELPTPSLRRIALKPAIRLQWSWCHRQEAGSSELLHIPDDRKLRDASLAQAGRRILSCHSIEQATELLTSYPDDQVLLSPWAPSLSKSQTHRSLNHHAVLQLVDRFPQRIHLTSGLTPNDFDQLQPYPFASLCLLGALRRDMASCLAQLQAHYRAFS